LENAENLRKEIRKVKQLTDNPFAVNYIFPMGGASEDPFTSAIYDVLIEEKIKVVLLL
jgi:enoyl-[acyl-carrier protein] reductase II